MCVEWYFKYKAKKYGVFFFYIKCYKNQDLQANNFKKNKSLKFISMIDLLNFYIVIYKLLDVVVLSSKSS